MKISISNFKLFLGILLFTINCSASTEHSILIKQLKNLSLEELTKIETFNIKANLAARKIQKLTETSTALFVITQDDIRRAGITSLPEALRMVPGIQVARMNSNKWAITARGLNGLFSSKLLVMIDGRSVYSILRSEVNWDIQDVLLENIERIEIIRGPGASLWGANAVNGIINIITKSSKYTQKNLITTTVGKGEENIIVGLRHGGKINDNGYYRIYGKFYEHDNFVDAKGINQQDYWQMKRAGLRIDQDISHNNNLTIQGDVYEGFTRQKLLSFDTGQPFDDIIDVSGFNLLGRWQADNLILQTYYDQTKRQEMLLNDQRGTFDIDLQHNWQRNATQELIWGLGYRYVYDEIDSSAAVSYIPNKRQDHLFSIFLQGGFKLQDFKLTLGSKIEHNGYSGLEIQPTARLLWNRNKHTVWTAVSRAIRSPTRSDEDAQYLLPGNAISTILQSLDYNDSKIPSNQVNTMILQGNKNYQAETVFAYELGYRFNVTNRFLLDATIFYNDYEKLSIFQPIKIIPPETIILQNMNKMFGETYGLEVAVSWQVNSSWRLISTYSYLNIQLHLDSDVVLVPPLDDFFSEKQENYSPNHQANIRSLLSLSNSLELDTVLYYVGELHEQVGVNSYIRSDIRLGWNPKHWQFSLGARNLFDKSRREFSNSVSGNYILADEVRRSFYLQMKYFF